MLSLVGLGGDPISSARAETNYQTAPGDACFLAPTLTYHKACRCPFFASFTNMVNPASLQILEKLFTRNQVSQVLPLLPGPTLTVLGEAAHGKPK